MRIPLLQRDFMALRQGISQHLSLLPKKNYHNIPFKNRAIYFKPYKNASFFFIRVNSVVSTAMSPAVSSSDNVNFNKLLRRLEREGLKRIRMFTSICMIYAVFWGPLFLTVAFGGRASEEGRGLASVGPPKDPTSHQVRKYTTRSQCQ